MNFSIRKLSFIVTLLVDWDSHFSFLDAKFPGGIFLENFMILHEMDRLCL